MKWVLGRLVRLLRRLRMKKKRRVFERLEDTESQGEGMGGGPVRTGLTHSVQLFFLPNSLTFDRFSFDH